jgi:hypothetical protein
MSPLPAHDGTLIPDPQIGDEIEQYAANPLDKIFTYTPIPTVILDSSLQVVEVSNSYLTIFDGSSLIYLILELQTTSSISAQH